MPASVKTDPFDWVKDRLERWGRWYVASMLGGYPRHSWEGRAMLRGGAAPSPPIGVIPIHHDTQAQETDLAIRELPIKHQAAVRLKWVAHGRERSIARELKCSRHCVRITLDEAYANLARALSNYS